MSSPITTAPRTYPIATGMFFLFLIVGTALAIGGVLGTWYFANAPGAYRPNGAAWPLAVISLVIGLFGIAAVFTALTSSLTLYPDAIELRGPLYRRRLRQEDIAGRRLIRSQYTTVLVIYPRKPGLKKLRITSGGYKTDTTFQTWLASVPDLDAQDLAASQTEIAADMHLGRTPEERAQRLAQGKRWAKALNLVAYGVIFWGALYPRPYELAIACLAALPLAALVLAGRSHGLYRLDQRRNDVHPSLIGLFMGPGFALALRAIQDLHLLEWKSMLAVTLVGAVVLTGVSTLVDRSLRERRGGLAALLFCMSAYMYGVLMQSNALLDRSVPQRFEVAVVGKHVTSGKNTTWYLRLNPWGPHHEVEDVSVSTALYNSVSPGQKVCIYLRSGALTFPWFWVEHCP